MDCVFIANVNTAAIDGAYDPNAIRDAFTTTGKKGLPDWTLLLGARGFPATIIVLNWPEKADEAIEYPRRSEHWEILQNIWPEWALEDRVDSDMLPSSVFWGLKSVLQKRRADVLDMLGDEGLRGSLLNWLAADNLVCWILLTLLELVLGNPPDRPLDNKLVEKRQYYSLAPLPGGETDLALTRDDEHGNFFV
jgi:hypothetical protein